MPVAEVAELADAPGSGPGSLNGSGGSSPLFGTATTPEVSEIFVIPDSQGDYLGDYLASLEVKRCRVDLPIRGSTPRKTLGTSGSTAGRFPSGFKGQRTRRPPWKPGTRSWSTASCRNPKPFP